MRARAGSRRSSRVVASYFGDEPGAALEGDVVPQPDERDQEAVADLDQEEDVDHAPEQPAEEAGQLDAAELHHGGVAADGGEVALVAVAERRRLIGPGEPRRDQAADITTHLLRGRRNAGHGAAVRPGRRRGVADRKDVRMA